MDDRRVILRRRPASRSQAGDDVCDAVMFAKRVLALVLLIATVAFLPIRLAAAEPLGGVNVQSDPRQLYGGCASDGTASYRSKELLLHEVGEATNDQLAVTVLSCGGATGSVGTAKVPCPTGSPFTYCIATSNDGIGNSVTVGVIRHDKVSTPYFKYTGCPTGAILRRKTDVVKESGQELRLLTGIVTLACAPATTGSKEAATPVPCPVDGPSPFATCLKTPNDGAGNEVVLGLIPAAGAGDLYALYGECHPGATTAYSAKKIILQKMGIRFLPVTSLVLLRCGGPSTGLPTAYSTINCRDVTATPAHFDQCVAGKDANGNYFALGIAVADSVR